VKRALALLAALGVCVGLAACATPAGVKPGTPEPEVLKTVGSPTSRSVTPGVGPRLLYSQQPWGYEAWAIQFDEQGRAISAAQMLTDEQFAKIRPGQQSRADIERLFGPPADRPAFALTNETSYMYRYLRDNVFPSAMWVYFDTGGVVTRTGGGLDPWTLGGGDRR